MFSCMQQKLTRGNRETWKRHIARSPVHVSRERTQDLRKRLGVHTVVSTLQVRRLIWAKKWLREETYREDERAGAGEAMRAIVFGRLSFEKEQALPSRFVRQFLEDLDDLRRFVCDAEEGDRVVEDARVAAGLRGVDLPREKRPEMVEMAVPATTIRKLLSYATRADLWPGQQPRETLTCEKCGARVRGERGLKTHLQQWCGQKRSRSADSVTFRSQDRDAGI